MSDSTQYVLAGDIGGTNTRLAVVNVSGRQPHITLKANYPSQEYASLGTVLTAFSETHQHPLQAACLGVAGPVHGQTASITNLPWQLDAGEIAAQLNLENVSLLNDLEAT